MCSPSVQTISVDLSIVSLVNLKRIYGRFAFEFLRWYIGWYNPTVLNEHCSEWIVGTSGVYLIVVAQHWPASRRYRCSELAVRGSDVNTLPNLELTINVFIVNT